MIILSARGRTNRLFIAIVAIAMLIGLYSSCLSGKALESSAIDAVVAEATSKESLGDHDGAIGLYLEALDRYPNSPRLLYNLAIAYADKGRYNDSLATLERLNRSTNRSNTKYLRAQGGIAAFSGDIDTALDCWRTVVELDPLDFESRDRLIDALMERESYEDAYRYALEAYGLHYFEKSLFEKLAILEKVTGRGDGESWELIASSLP